MRKYRNALAPTLSSSALGAPSAPSAALFRRRLDRSPKGGAAEPVCSEPRDAWKPAIPAPIRTHTAQVSSATVPRVIGNRIHAAVRLERNGRDGTGGDHSDTSAFVPDSPPPLGRADREVL